MSNVHDTPWDLWQDITTPETWQKAIQHLALSLTSGQQETLSSYRHLEEYCRLVRRQDWHEGDRLTGELLMLWADALELGALVGYALARTQPAHLDEMDDWPRRALELAGLGCDHGCPDHN